MRPPWAGGPRRRHVQRGITVDREQSTGSAPVNDAAASGQARHSLVRDRLVRARDGPDAACRRRVFDTTGFAVVTKKLAAVPIATMGRVRGEAALRGSCEQQASPASLVAAWSCRRRVAAPAVTGGRGQDHRGATRRSCRRGLDRGDRLPVAAVLPDHGWRGSERAVDQRAERRRARLVDSGAGVLNRQHLHDAVVDGHGIAARAHAHAARGQVELQADLLGEFG